MRNETLQSFERLLDIMDELREKCPWDRRQTIESLRMQTIEETYELCDAILDADWQDIRKELGDLLLHIVFYAKIGEEQQQFDIKDVIDGISEKLVYRHPHIFGDGKAETAEAVRENWEKLKLKEKGGNKSVLGGVPKSLPALVKAYRIQDKARSAGFDWQDRREVWDKVREEIGEFSEAVEAQQPSAMEAEFGDLLFSLINAARLYKIDPESALERTNRKFIGRFDYIESQTIDQGRSLQDLSLEEMDALWNEAKRRE
ncbi:MAG: nucleoside triphosphate pyrophosphohydrolase [Bacteroidales bacterium]|nr:nucleoside triphosphate pyrophosphohydrolase [Bacteroidales bacterium]